MEFVLQQQPESPTTLNPIEVNKKTTPPPSRRSIRRSTSQYKPSFIAL
jgi:hypothetical protein